MLNSIHLFILLLEVFSFLKRYVIIDEQKGVKDMENEILKVLYNRTSLRVFDKREVTKEEEAAIIKSAMLAPTAGNQMLYSMIIIRDQQKKEKLSELCDKQVFIAKAPLVIIFVADHHKWFDYYKMNGVKEFSESCDLCFEAPQESDLMLAIEDAMIAAQNSVIAAESMGIGSCYIGDIVENYEEIQSLLRLPEYTFPIGMLCYGHYQETHVKKFRKRFDQKYVVFEDSYRQLSKEEYNDMFQDQEQVYRPENAYAASNYAQQFYARKTGASFSKEMARSVRVALKGWDGRKL